MIDGQNKMHKLTANKLESVFMYNETVKIREETGFVEQMFYYSTEFTACLVQKCESLVLETKNGLCIKNI